MHAAATRESPLVWTIFEKLTLHLIVIIIISDVVIVEEQILSPCQPTYQHHLPQRPKGSNAQEWTPDYGMYFLTVRINILEIVACLCLGTLDSYRQLAIFHYSIFKYVKGLRIQFWRQIKAEMFIFLSLRILF